MEEQKPVSDLFAGLLGVAVIGLLVAIMLFGVLSLGGNSDLARLETSPQPPPAPPISTN